VPAKKPFKFSDLQEYRFRGLPAFSACIRRFWW